MTIFQDDNVEAVRVFEQSWKGEKLLEVRTGKVKPVFGINIKSAIFKNSRSGPVSVNKLGCDGDEHAFERHGGPEKVLLQYSAAHYDRFRDELPQSSHLFAPGGFGENLVANHANERNICIGDIIEIDAVVAEVKDMSKRSQDLFRTGWMYRILKEGVIQAGDNMKLLERPNPAWTVAKIQHYLYHDMRNEEVMKQIVEIKELGAEARTIFQNRLNRQYENQELRLLGNAGHAMNIWTDYRLVKK